MKEFSPLPSIEFERIESLKGLEFMRPLYKAISSRKAVELNYHPFTHKEPLNLVFHPYLLKEYNNRWFVLGMHDSENRLWSLALDRIISVGQSSTRFRPAQGIGLTVYFRDVIGITVPENEKPSRIVIRFSHDTAPYIKTKPIHRSQEILHEDSDGMTVSLKLIPNYEFYASILYYGDGAVILEPETVRNHIAAILGRAWKYYTGQEE
jgi:predicted DNA-binding transcriptional regulator YafY